ESRTVEEQRDGRIPEGALAVTLRKVSETPVDIESDGERAIPVDRLERVACDDEPRAVDLLRRRDCVAEALVRADDAEAEQRAPIVASCRITRKDRVRDHAQPLLRHDLRKRLAAALTVHDDPVEAGEQPVPELPLRGGAPRQQVVRREDRRLPEA